MRGMEDYEARIRAAAKKRDRAKAALTAADKELHAEFIAARADGIGPSDMSRWSGLTREWIAKIAPDPNKTSAG